MKKYLLMVPLIFWVPYSFSQNPNDDLFDMDLEALMKIEVSVASKRLEDISQAPGVINVITAEEIKSYGSQRLSDILSRMPGVYNYGTPILPNNVTAVRGQINNGADTHILFLMNNRPLRTGFNGGDNRNILSSFPIDMIERIEVIRGPGSVLYGTNAFSGVVNIVTEKAKENIQGNVSGGYGTFDTKLSGLSLAGKSDDGDLNYHVSGNYQDSDGWDIEGFDQSGTFDSDKASSYSHSVAGNLEYKDIHLNFFHGGINDAIFNSTYNYPLSSFGAISTFIDLGYEHAISKKWTASANMAYSSHKSDFDNGLIRADTGDTLIETTFKGELTQNFNIIFGALMNRLAGKDIGTFQYSYDSNRYSSYVQADYQYKSWLKFVAGAQFNKPEEVDLDISPRLGVIANLSKNWGSKLLYGKAFRDAYPAEQFILIPNSLNGNPLLKPETIQTIDWQIYYQSAKYYSALTFFRSWQRNTIDAVGTNYENTTGIDSYGLELEGQAQVLSNLSLQGSLSLQENEDTDGISDVYENPNLLLKLGAQYKSDRGYSLGVFNTYIGEIKQSTTKSVSLNPNAGDYHWLTANLTLDINNLLNLNHWPSTVISIYGGNLLDVDAYGPTDSVANLNTILIRASRYVFVSAKVSF